MRWVENQGNARKEVWLFPSEYEETHPGSPHNTAIRRVAYLCQVSFLLTLESQLYVSQLQVPLVCTSNS